MSVVIIDYGSGNLRSAEKSFERAAREADLGLDVLVSNKPEDVANADRVVLPGVGAFGDCAQGLRALDGMYEALDEAVHQKGKPFMGICVGMQLMADRGLEHGSHEGLGWIGGEVVAIKPEDKALKIPHMGWNELSFDEGAHPLLADIPKANVYFVHSYQFKTADPAHQLATVSYGGDVTAVIGRDNMVGTQFHPEKSQAIGLKVITNFLKWKP
ncbi:Imidazole glycerol phosphate synthase subunit HisH [Candidatus Terasakiella magnetica]|uniref:Imidazole glycerol phosphate synthase subunit HisH n=1 Tax=Candidatus Terasakiella magnetica TaxID=1867952 RepID=A0A1C3RG36_9PROT|nr:imidazole glycerol phosphate synthase subunit HisH [Candidatus Terasakiella magnetica]SCA56263.1 Imidazole glycerol phosphate synthase subunit HisH [Candidatus Terasakiella magnetica]